MVRLRSLLMPLLVLCVATIVSGCYVTVGTNGQATVHQGTPPLLLTAATTVPHATPTTTTAPRSTTTPSTTAPSTTAPPSELSAPTTTVPPVTVPPATAPPVTSPVSVTKPPVPSSGVLVGAYVQPRPAQDKASEQALWTRRQADSSRRYDIANLYYAFTKPFPTWRESWQISQGRTPMISWGQGDTVQIESGADDAMIRARADALRDLGAPVFLRWMAEMDGNQKAALAHDPADFIGAWRRIHTIFQQEGATNVSFVWSPNSWTYDANAAAAAQWYPGNAYVDWVGADGYNWAPQQAGAPWSSFQTVFANFYRWAATTGKPIMIGEFGAMERSAGDKAAWITAIGPALRAMPAIKAVVYFDAVVADPKGGNDDWRLDSTPSSYAAWNALIAEPGLAPAY